MTRRRVNNVNPTSMLSRHFLDESEVSCKCCHDDVVFVLVAVRVVVFNDAVTTVVFMLT